MQHNNLTAYNDITIHDCSAVLICWCCLLLACSVFCLLEERPTRCKIVEQIEVTSCTLIRQCRSVLRKVLMYAFK
jgi:hypothetical protein